MTIAGHDFPNHGPCTCGIRWLDIRNTRQTEVQQPNIAHTGNLTAHEYEQIEVARGAEDARIEAAMMEVGR